jgi:hypothetical protein
MSQSVSEWKSKIKNVSKIAQKEEGGGGEKLPKKKHFLPKIDE